ncbi:MAG: helix-turn-helix domain-containing protein [Marmoricola sp.]
MTSIRHKSLAASAEDAVIPTTADDGYLDAARSAILAVGWSRTTLTDIARRAGVSRMTLYRRWPDTQTLLADLMTREWGRVVGEAADSTGPTTTGPTTTGPLHRVTEGVIATVRGLRANELLRRIIDVDPELLLPYLLDRRGRSQDLLATAIAALIRDGQVTGAIRSGDAELLARSLLLACHGFALSAHTMTEGPSPSRDADVTELDAELAHLVERFLQP